MAIPYEKACVEYVLDGGHEAVRVDYEGEEADWTISIFTKPPLQNTKNSGNFFSLHFLTLDIRYLKKGIFATKGNIVNNLLKSYKKTF
jgi:hypothetical protein